MMDTMALFARVPAERIVFGSDPPYGRTFVGLYLVLRMLACLGIDAETRAGTWSAAPSRDLVDGRAAGARDRPARRREQMPAGRASWRGCTRT